VKVEYVPPKQYRGYTWARLSAGFRRRPQQDPAVGRGAHAAAV